MLRVAVVETVLNVSWGNWQWPLLCSHKGLRFWFSDFILRHGQRRGELLVEGEEVTDLALLCRHQSEFGQQPIENSLLVIDCSTANLAQ